MTLTKIPSYIKAVYISLLIIIIIFFMIMAKSILVPLMVSSYIGMLMIPLCNRLERSKIPRSLSAFIALLLIMTLLTLLIYGVVTQIQILSDDLGNVEQDLNKFVIGINTTVSNNTGLDLGMQYGFKTEKLLEIVQSGDANPQKMIAMTLGTISSILMLPIFIFFMLIYRDHIAVFIMKVFTNERNKILLEHITDIRRIVHAYLIGASKVMLILGIVNTGVLFALGIKHALFFGMLAGMLNIIPYIGPLFGAILPLIYALVTKDSLFYPLAVAISFTIIQFLEGSFLTPKITGTNVNLNAFVTFVGLLVGGAIWGIVGMILIIPTIAILKRLFELNPATEPYAYLFGEEDHRWFKRNKN